MEPLSAPEIRGNWATLLLPINENETIDFRALNAEIDFILAANVKGIYTKGTAREFLTQSETEFARISELLAEKCKKTVCHFKSARHTLVRRRCSNALVSQFG